MRNFKSIFMKTQMISKVFLTKYRIKRFQRDARNKDLFYFRYAELS